MTNRRAQEVLEKLKESSFILQEEQEAIRMALEEMKAVNILRAIVGRETEAE